MADATATQAGTREIVLPAGTWTLDRAHTSIEFVARHMMVTKVRGNFGDFEGAIHVSEDPAASWAEASLKTATINSNMPMRDDHLRSADFLDSEKFPEMKFRSTSLQHVGENKWKAVGDLTVRDVTKPVDLDVEFHGYQDHPMGGEVAFFSGKAVIDREQFGMTWNQALESGGVLVSKKVKIEIEAQAVRGRDS